eukprot:1948450-Pyramimonas_sp.AAC.1
MSIGPLSRLAYARIIQACVWVASLDIPGQLPKRMTCGCSAARFGRTRTRCYNTAIGHHNGAGWTICELRGSPRYPARTNARHPTTPTMEPHQGRREPRRTVPTPVREVECLARSEACLEGTQGAVRRSRRSRILHKPPRQGLLKYPERQTLRRAQRSHTLGAMFTHRRVSHVFRIDRHTSTWEPSTHIVRIFDCSQEFHNRDAAPRRTGSSSLGRKNDRAKSMMSTDAAIGSLRCTRVPDRVVSYARSRSLSPHQVCLDVILSHCTVPLSTSRKCSLSLSLKVNDILCT